MEQKLFASQDMAAPANGLGDGRTQRARKVRPADSGAHLDGRDGGGGTVDGTAAGPDPGMAVAGRTESAAPQLEWDREANIHVRMIRAQAQAKRLEKEKPADGSDGAKFLKNGYITHDAVTAEAVRILTRNGIHFQPYVKAHVQDGNRTVIEMEGVFTNVDRPDETLRFPGFGYGVDGSDKGPGKAMSYAKKMVLSQALMLNTHEDIEEHSTDYQPAAAPAQLKEAQAQTETAIRTWADTFKRTLDGCASKADLKRIRAENAAMLQSPALPDVTRDYFVSMISQLESDLP